VDQPRPRGATAKDPRIRAIRSAPDWPLKMVGLMRVAPVAARYLPDRVSGGHDRRASGRSVGDPSSPARPRRSHWVTPAALRSTTLTLLGIVNFPRRFSRTR